MTSIFIPKNMSESGTRQFSFDFQHGKSCTSMHWHSCAEVIYNQKGYIDVCFCDKIYTLEEGELIFLPPGRPHFCECNDLDAQRVVLGFTEQLICREKERDRFLLSPFFDKAVFPFCIFQREECQNIQENFDSLTELDRLRPTAYTLLMQAEILQIYSYLLSIWSDMGIFNQNVKQNATVSAILNRLQSAIDSPPDAVSLAAEFNISYSHMARLLKENLNTDYTQLTRSMKLDRAKKLLLSSELSVTEIAMDCGFCDSSYFIKLFKSSTGMSPNVYRKSFSENII